MSATLLPCPFCGGEASFGTQRCSADRAGVLGAGRQQVVHHFASCIVCGCGTSVLIPAETQEGAAKTWNNRTTDHTAAREPAG